eukprot:1160393-Pelagomonas_calceolata.AAC.10
MQWRAAAGQRQRLLELVVVPGAAAERVHRTSSGATGTGPRSADDHVPGEAELQCDLVAQLQCTWAICPGKPACWIGAIVLATVQWLAKAHRWIMTTQL